MSIQTINLVCATCDTSFEKVYSHYTKSIRLGQNKFFCCKECSDLGKSRSMAKVTLLTCDRCGIEFERLTREVNKRIKLGSQKFFCSQDCGAQRGTGIQSIRNYRQQALSFYGHACSICNYNLIVEIHHKDGNRSNNELDNLAVLCPNHHAEYERGFRTYE